MAFPERIGRVTLATVPKVARTCKLYADRNGSALVAIDSTGVYWVTWPHNSTASRILDNMPETVLGTFARGVNQEAIEWELWHEVAA